MFGSTFFGIYILLTDIFVSDLNVATKKNSFYMINDAVTKELGYVRDRNKASNLGLDGCKKGRYCKWRVQTRYHLRETGQAMMQERVFSD